MDRRYSKKGLTIIAAEVQASSTDAIQKIVEEGRIEYTVTSGYRGPSLGRGIPHMAVFDATGKLVFSGHPMQDEAEDAIKDALKAVKVDGGGEASGLMPRSSSLVPQRGWTNSDGKTIEATLLEVNGTVGKFKLSNGRPFEYDITKLSEADQLIIEAAAKPKAE